MSSLTFSSPPLFASWAFRRVEETPNPRTCSSCRSGRSDYLQKPKIFLYEKCTEQYKPSYIWVLAYKARNWKSGQINVSIPAVSSHRSPIFEWQEKGLKNKKGKNLTYTNLTFGGPIWANCPWVNSPVTIQMTGEKMEIQ